MPCIPKKVADNLPSLAVKELMPVVVVLVVCAGGLEKNGGDRETRNWTYTVSHPICK